MGWLGWLWGKEGDQPQQKAATTDPASGPKKKICCACPETKALRDDCTVAYGPEDERCLPLIEAHIKCLRAEGFKV